MLRQVREVIIVEGRYDKSAVLGAVDATVFETSGFGIFSDKEKIALFHSLAAKRGLIILTDSDRAGFFIRGRLRGMLDDKNVKHAYIPDIEGREKRKAAYSKEGKLGVEGMDADVIIMALERAGATFSDADEISKHGCSEPITRSEPITAADLYTAGLSGGPHSAQKRRDFLHSLGLPKRLTGGKLLSVLNILYTRQEFIDFTIYKI